MTRSLEFPRIWETLVTPLGVFLGLTWGYALRQVDEAGRAMLLLQSFNATSVLGSWVSQTQNSLNLVLRATASLAVLFAAFLLIPRIPRESSASPRLQQLFPLLTTVAWFALLLSAMATAIPQAFLSVRVVCGSYGAEVDFAVGQIFAFLEFTRTYVAAAGVLAMLTGIWLASALLNGPLYHQGRIVRSGSALLVPLATFFVDITLIPLQDAVIGPCVEFSGSGTVEVLPS